MPEFNRNFAEGKMNKDLDERLVPAGGYRDALNVEVATSEGSDVGALQTIWGNTNVTPDIVPAGSYCVGKIVNNEENCIYWLVAGAEEEVSAGHFITKDFIIKYHVDTGLSTYVFVDIHNVRVKVSSTTIGANNYVTLGSSEGIRPGMAARFNNNNLVVDFANTISNNNIYPLPGFDLGTLNVGDELIFTSRRVLNFSKYLDITGINIVDDFIMFTDDISEPKIVSIKRSLMGTGGVQANGWFSIGQGQDAKTHTRLISDRRDGLWQDDGFEVVNNPKYPDSAPEFSELENNTTIKKNPLTPPTINMSTTIAGGSAGSTVGAIDYGLFVTGTEPIVVANTGTMHTLTFLQTDADGNALEPMGLIPGDFVVLTNDTNQNPNSFTNFDVRLQVVAQIDAWTFSFTLLSIDPELDTTTYFFANKQQTEPLFEFKFPRFAYRYKYVDGQYSGFSPFSEVAFLPGPFSYDPKEGYNLGMANRVRGLQVQNYAPHPDNRPKDVVEIDILYKEDKSTAVYTVKTLTRKDGISPTGGASALWPEDVNNTGVDYMGITRGSIDITSELIHAVVPENQLLRPWDNVPRLAKAQEVSGNRLIYANYLQNFDLLDVNNKLITPTADLTSVSTPYDSIITANVEDPLKSVKTMRTYQLGVVYRDEMGRETPVLADKEGGSIYLGKEFCDQQTQLITKINNNAPNWATSFKFFIKETSDEYYNLALDRWYAAEDGNVWLSFQSSDRNKVDIETFLELKKAHDTAVPVTEPARYKVLAIENEAPQYIKLDRKSQGIVTNGVANTTVNNDIGSTVQGFPADGGNFITIRKEAFEETFNNDNGQNPVYTKTSECSLKIKRITGDRSEWYNIVSIEEGAWFDGTGALNGYKITVSDPFGPDVNFCSTDNTWDGRVSGLQVQITHDEYEDKPEFDGKFFVKVFRDRVLEDNVIILDDEDLMVVNAYPVAYLHTYKLTTGGTGNIANTKNDQFGVSASPLDKYIDGLAGCGRLSPLTTDVAGGTSCHPHPFDYENDNSGGAVYRWGDNSAAGVLPHPYMDYDTVDPWQIVSDPSEMNYDGPYFLAYAAWRGALQAHSTATNTVAATLTAAGISGWGVSRYPLEWLQNPLSQGVNPLAPAWTTYGMVAGTSAALVFSVTTSQHYGIAKWQFGSLFWESLTTRVIDGNETSGHAYVFIDDAWALSWCITDELVHNSYRSGIGGSDGDQMTRQYIASREMHSAPFVGDYGTGGNGLFVDNVFTDPIETESGFAQQGADLLLAPWNATSTGNATEVNIQNNIVLGEYFANEGSMVDGYTSGSYTINTSGNTQALNSGNLSKGFEGNPAPPWAQNGSAGVRGNLIDISVVGGMPGRESGALMDDDGSTKDHMRLMGSGVEITSSTDEVEFFDQIMSNGVKWRFRQDPDSTVYETTGSYEHYGIINCQRSDAAMLALNDRGQYFHSYNKRNKFTIQVDQDFGSGATGWIPTHNMAHDGSETITFEILGTSSTDQGGPPSDNPAVFETHPKEDIGLDIYYEISRAYPVRISKEDDETLTLRGSNIEGHLNAAGTFTPLSVNIVDYEFDTDPGTVGMIKLTTDTDMSTLGIALLNGDVFRVRDSWGGAVDIVIGQVPAAGEFFLWIDANIHNKRIELPWHNCYVFGNGVESDRIRDDFNQPTIQNGVKASTTIAEQYKEERRKEGLIFSGIFNSRTGVNRLNQFIQAEPITKDLNPDNGSIQKLFARDTDIVTFCEDKVLKILSQKDALFNADGNTNVTATSKVLGTAIPFQGDYGISKNPESFAEDRFRCYFADVQRGAVLRLSKDGITNISDYGMRDWFTDKFYSLDRPRIIGSFDARKENYNITITNRSGEVSVVPYQNVNPGELMFTGITAGMYENGLGHIEPVFDNHPDPHPDPQPESCGLPHPLLPHGFTGWDSSGSFTSAVGTTYYPSGYYITANGTPQQWIGITDDFDPARFETPYYGDVANSLEGSQKAIPNHPLGAAFGIEHYDENFGVNYQDTWDGENCNVYMGPGPAPYIGPSINVIQWGDPNSPVGNSSSGPNTQFSTDCDSFWMPPEGPDALPNVPGFSDCGWPLNGQFVIGNTTYSVEGWALTQSAVGAAYSQTFFAWPSVLNPNPPTINSMTVLNMDHFMEHGSWAMNMQNN